MKSIQYNQSFFFSTNVKNQCRRRVGCNPCAAWVTLNCNIIDNCHCECPQAAAARESGFRSSTRPGFLDFSVENLWLSFAPRSFSAGVPEKRS
jgi:hypothetical protein